MIFDFFAEILFRRMLVGFFGYYTLYLIFKIFKNKERLKWLQNPCGDEGDEFGKSCFMGLVGMISFVG